MLDGTSVVLKRYTKSASPREVAIGLRLSSVPLMSDHRNHAVHVYEELDVPDFPDEGLIVMDMLRKYNVPNFETIGEVVDFFRQVSEVGLMQSLNLTLTLIISQGPAISSPAPHNPWVWRPVLHGELR